MMKVRRTMRMRARVEVRRGDTLISSGENQVFCNSEVATTGYLYVF
jgi:hypothetical protein